MKIHMEVKWQAITKKLDTSSKSSGRSWTCSLKSITCREFTTRFACSSEGFDIPEPMDIVAEVAQHLGEGRRCAAWP